MKSQKRAESIQLGRQLLKNALVDSGITLKKIPDECFMTVVKEASLKTLDDLLEEIGLGNRAAALVAGRMHALMQEQLGGAAAPPVQDKPLVIKGTEGIVVHYATCCYPVPGDPVVGIMDMGKGILVHVESCAQIAKMRRQRDRLLPLRWSSHATGDFMAAIHVQVINERGVLAVMALAIADAEANIEDIQVEEKDGRHYNVCFKLLVADRAHLARVIRALRSVKCVTRIRRG